MLSQNMPQLISQLRALHIDVQFNDKSDRIVLHLPASSNIDAADELVCDAVFVDPAERVMEKNGWTIHLNKRSANRPPCADMQVVPQNTAVFTYLFSDHAA